MPRETRFGLGVLAAALGLGVVVDLLLRETPYGVNVLLWAGNAQDLARLERPLGREREGEDEEPSPQLPASPSASSRRSSTGSRNVTSSSTS